MRETLRLVEVMRVVVREVTYSSSPLGVMKPGIVDDLLLDLKVRVVASIVVLVPLVTGAVSVELSLRLGSSNLAGALTGDLVIEL
jgi:hypothetical protein